MLNVAAFHALQMKKRDNLSSSNALVIQLIRNVGGKDTKSTFQVDSTAIVPFDDETVAQFGFRAHYNAILQKGAKYAILVLIRIDTAMQLVPFGITDELYGPRGILPRDDPDWEATLREAINSRLTI